jgi:3-hydroxyisobutyrate dehydrogenase-like beta-hydroxyacid dehydrogenase
MVTIGILSPGDMGHGVGGALKSKGARVVASLDDRSARTRDLAEEAGIEDVGSLDNLVSQSDIILSILVPSFATSAATLVAQAIERTKAEVIYVDANAIAPSTVQNIAAIVTGAGARFADIGIMGSPPPAPNTRFAVSGPAREEVGKVLADHGLAVDMLGEGIGQASGLKMCYAAFTKGSTALATAVLVTAERLGLTDALMAQPGSVGAEKKLGNTVPAMTVKAHRWIGEMEEIAKTFEEAGTTPHFHLGAADLYRLVKSTSLAEETPETRDKSRTVEQVIKILAAGVDGTGKPGSQS